MKNLLPHFFPTSRNLSCLSYLSKIIHRLFEAGLFQKIHEDEEFKLKVKMKTVSNEPDLPKILQLHNLKGAFLYCSPDTLYQ